MARLRHILRLNAVSCIGFGVLLAFSPAMVGAFLGSMPDILLASIGVVLLINGAHLVAASFRPRLIEAEVLWFSFGDLAWWFASMGFLATGIFVTKPAGVVGLVLVAIFVAGLGIAQIALLGISRSRNAPASHWRCIGRSWMSLPFWVKLWLVFLNAVFLAAPIFLAWADTFVILVGYAASGPLLLAFAFWHGGLSRIMGVAHLLPWVPLLGWLVFRLATADLAPSEVAYLLTLGATIAVCLAFDVYDAWRWVRGERKVISGPPTPTNCLPALQS